MLRRLLVLISFGVVLVAPTLTAIAPTFATPSQVPVAFQGFLPAGFDLEDVSVEVIPNSNILASEKRAETLPIPQSSLELSAGILTARVLPASLGNQFLSSLGRADYKILAADGTQIWTTLVSSQALEDAATGANYWVDPVSAVSLVSSPKTTFHGRVPVIHGSQARSSRPEPPKFASPDGAGGTGDARMTATALNNDQEEWDGGSAAPAPSRCPDGGSGPHQINKVGEVLVLSTIGTTYPTGDSTAWMKVSSTSSTGATYGAAVSYAGASFNASGSDFAEGTWSKTWNAMKNSRSYQKQVQYYKYYWSGYLNPDCNHYHYLPVSETGGTADNPGIDRPDWRTYCVPESAGPWSRDNSGGKTYDYGSAVKFASIIGIDLGIKRAYSSAQSVNYNVVGKKVLCGNNAYPAEAGKIIERWAGSS